MQLTTGRYQVRPPTMISIAFDLFKYAFWWITFAAYQMVVRILMFFVPTKLVQHLITENFRQHGIKVTVDGDETPGKYDKEKYSCEMIIHNPKFFKRLACDMIGLGESYMVRNCLVVKAKQNNGLIEIISKSNLAFSPGTFLILTG